MTHASTCVCSVNGLMRESACARSLSRVRPLSLKGVASSANIDDAGGLLIHSCPVFASSDGGATIYVLDVMSDRAAGRRNEEARPLQLRIRTRGIMCHLA
jgi:hypothetical protein